MREIGKLLIGRPLPASRCNVLLGNAPHRTHLVKTAGVRYLASIRSMPFLNAVGKPSAVFPRRVLHAARMLVNEDLQTHGHGTRNLARSAAR